MISQMMNGLPLLIHILSSLNVSDLIQSGQQKMEICDRSVSTA